MKKLFIILCGVTLVFGMAGIAGAIPCSWTDTKDFSDHYIGWYESYSYTHDITDDGFVPGSAIVTSYSLSISLYDDGGKWDSGEIAYISQPGLLGDAIYDFSFTSMTTGWSLAGIIDLSLDGILGVKICSAWGDFYLAESVLSAEGCCDSAPVPEPATILLMGVGLLGLVGYSRKRFSKKS